MAKTISVTAQMEAVLDEISEEARELSDKNAKVCAKEASAKLQSASPKKTGSYAKGWTSKKLGQGAYVVYNKTDAPLTHLLENGHAIVNKKGSFGRVPGIKHIEPVEKEFVEKFFEDCMRDKL